MAPLSGTVKVMVISRIAINAARLQFLKRSASTDSVILKVGLHKRLIVQLVGQHCVIWCHMVSWCKPPSRLFCEANLWNWGWSQVGRTLAAILNQWPISDHCHAAQCDPTYWGLNCSCKHPLLISHTTPCCYPDR